MSTGYCCCRSRSRSCRSPSRSPLLLLREWLVAPLPLMPITDPSCAELAPEAVKAVGVPDSCAWSMLRFFSRSRPITGTCCNSRSFSVFWRACTGAGARGKVKAQTTQNHDPKRPERCTTIHKHKSTTFVQD